MKAEEQSRRGAMEPLTGRDGLGLGSNLQQKIQSRGFFFKCVNRKLT